MKLEEIQIRETSVNDFADIMEVEKTAFGYDKEAELVADLLKDPSAEPRLSLLARYNGKAVGHILFTKAEIEGAAIPYPCSTGCNTRFSETGNWRVTNPQRDTNAERKRYQTCLCIGTQGILSPTWFHTKRPRYGLYHTIPEPDTHRICRILDDTGADR